MSATDEAQDLTTGSVQWLHNLHFHLGPNTCGRYIFSHVHLNDSPLWRHREGFLQDLMTGRSINEVLSILTPQPTASDNQLPDNQTADELRQYFHRLAQQLHLSPPTAKSTNGLSH